MLSFLSKMKCVYCFLIIRQCLSYSTDNSSFRVTIEGCLKDSSELRVTIVDEHFVTSGLTKFIDNIRKCKKTSVNV